MSRRSVAALLVVLALLLSSADLEAKRRKKRHRARRPAPVAAANFDRKLPVLGTRLSSFPAGAAKPTADTACLTCHSADMVCQQHLTEKQWTAVVSKMIGWGAVVPPDARAGLVEYLVANFGPNNDRFTPVITRPVGK